MQFVSVGCDPTLYGDAVSGFSLPECVLMDCILSGDIVTKDRALFCPEPGPWAGYYTVYITDADGWTGQFACPGPIVRTLEHLGLIARKAFQGGRVEWVGRPANAPRPGVSQHRHRVEPVPPRGFRVIVGNVGTVYDGRDLTEANRTYRHYVGQSRAGCGRAGGESVTLFEGDDVSREHPGTVGE